MIHIKLPTKYSKAPISTLLPLYIQPELNKHFKFERTENASMAFQCSSDLCSIANFFLYVIAIVVLFAFCVAALANEPDKRTWKTCSLVSMSVLSAFTLSFFAIICGEVYYIVSSILFNLWNIGISGDSGVRRWTLRL